MSARRILTLTLHATLLGTVLSGCTWITEADWKAFNDRDNDGLSHQQDCDDSDKNVKDTVAFYPDVDGDGFGDAEAQPVQHCANEAPKGLVTDNTDCDDGNPAALPGGVEVCDTLNIDEDCNGAADDADNAAEGKVLWYTDQDGDGFGDMNGAGTTACDPPTGSEVQDNTDCDDSLSSVNPNGTEVCDPDDNDENCDGLADDDLGANPDAASLVQWYDDADSDGYGNPNYPQEIQCDQPGGRADNNSDCDESNPAINPGATEVCDPLDVDEDCDATADDADASADPATMTAFYPDADADGFGDMNGIATLACDPLPYEVADQLDCDDADPAINPDADELCDPGYVDEDCNGYVNMADPGLLVVPDWWPDGDSDGFGIDGPPASSGCSQPKGHVSVGGDCDDTDPNIFPGAPEYHHDGGADSDCDGFDWVCGSSVILVDDTGLPGVNADFTLIQAAVDAIDGITWCETDVIEVRPGTYLEDIDISDMDLTVIGVVGPLSTVIQGTGTNRVVSLNRTATWFEGFRVTGGSVVGDGGGVRVFYGDGTVLENLVVDGNAATNGGGIDLRHPTSVTISNTTVTNNSTSTGDGGGISMSSLNAQAGGNVLLTGLDVNSNVAFDAGGGIFMDMDDDSGAFNLLNITIEQSVIEGNTAVFGGGIYATDTPQLTISGVDVINNVGQSNVGGVQLVDTPGLVEDVLIQGNTGVTVGGMQISDQQAGPNTLRDVRMLDNIIGQTDGNGYGLYIKGHHSFGSVIERIEIARTVRSIGPLFSWGAALAIEGKTSVDNALIYDEQAPAALRLSEAATGIAATHEVRNATIVGCDNDAIEVANAIASSLELTNIVAAHNGGYGIDQVVLPASVTYSSMYSNTAGAYNGTNHTGQFGNVEEDPTFVDYNPGNNSLTWDLHLDVGSTLIDAGDPSILDADGSPSDMGYYGGPLAP